MHGHSNIKEDWVERCLKKDKKWRFNVPQKEQGKLGDRNKGRKRKTARTKERWNTRSRPKGKKMCGRGI